MDISVSPTELARRIGHFARRAQDSRQVGRRLKRLLPSRLVSLKNTYQSKHKPGRALRLALADKAYQNHIDQCVAVQSEAFEARIRYETHMMLQSARVSIRAWHRRD